MKCRLCPNDASPSLSISGIGPVCHSCYQKPQKRSHREEMEQKLGKKRIDTKDRKLGEFV